MSCLKKMSDEDGFGDLELVRRALDGDRKAREKIALVARPIVENRVQTLCKQYCGRNRSQYACTVDVAWGQKPQDAVYCDWGNESYRFFYEEAVGDKVLERYEARNGASLKSYLTATVRAHGARERWKDLRFGRRVTVPKCVERLGGDAKRLFYWSVDGDTLPNMAQRLGKPEDEVKQLMSLINQELVKHHLTYRLEQLREVSLIATETSSEQGVEQEGALELSANLVSAEDLEIREIVKAGFEELDWVEQFVLWAMVVDGLDAKSVLQALEEEGVCLKEGVPAKETKIQSVYYFCYKAIDKLKKICRL